MISQQEWIYVLSNFINIIASLLNKGLGYNDKRIESVLLFLLFLVFISIILSVSFIRFITSFLNPFIYFFILNFLKPTISNKWTWKSFLLEDIFCDVYDILV